MALGAKDSSDLYCSKGWHGRRDEGGVAWGRGGAVRGKDVACKLTHSGALWRGRRKGGLRGYRVNNDDARMMLMRDTQSHLACSATGAKGGGRGCLTLAPHCTEIRNWRGTVVGVRCVWPI